MIGRKGKELLRRELDKINSLEILTCQDEEPKNMTNGYLWETPKNTDGSDSEVAPLVDKASQCLSSWPSLIDYPEGQSLILSERHEIGEIEICNKTRN